jgi:hypothetical protein
MGVLQIAGGIILLDTDVTRGTPAIIEAHGIAMQTFGSAMLAAGLVTAFVALFRLSLVKVPQMVFLTLPFVLYIGFTIQGALSGVISAQGALIYSIFYGIVLVTVWGFD